MLQRSRTFVHVLLCAATLAASDGTAQEQYTLEQVMSAPFPGNLTAAPSGGSVAWVFNARGVRNIWIAEPPEYAGRQLTQYRADDGQLISALQWLPDARSIVYVRGGARNRQGEYPNPRSVPEGVTQQIWIAEVTGAEPRMLAEGSSPRASPTGDRIAYLKGGEIWTVLLAGGDPQPIGRGSRRR